MADRIEWFPITIPANTPVAAPLMFDTSFFQGTVTEIDVKVPPGPAGNVGFAIYAGGSQYLPRNEGIYIYPDDDYFLWAIENAINSGSWAVAAFNTDVWDHTIQIGFHVNEIAVSPAGFTSSPVSV